MKALPTIAALGLASLCLGRAWGAPAPVAAPGPERFLPAGTAAVLCVPRFDEARKRFEASAGGRLAADPAMKRLRDQFMGRLRTGLLGPLTLNFGLNLETWAGLLEGPVMLAWTTNDWSAQGGGSAGFVLLADTGSHQGQLSNTLAQLSQAWRQAGRSLQAVRIRDQEFVTFSFSSSDMDLLLEKAFPHPKGEPVEAAAEPPQRMAWTLGQSGAWLVLGKSLKDIEQVLALQAGVEGPSLAGQPAFLAEAPVWRGAQAYAWAGMQGLLARWMAPGKAGAEAPVLPTLLEPLGLAGVQAVTAALSQDGSGTALQLWLRAPEASRKGLLQMLSPQAKEASPPAFVPAAAVKFVRARLDLLRAWNTAEAMVGAAMPPLAGLIKGIITSAGKEADPNFDFRERAINTLGDDVVWWQKAPRGATLDDLDEAPSILLAGARKPEQLADSLKAIVSGLPPELARYKERDFLGRTLYSLNPPFAVAGEEASGRARGLNYCASGPYVAFSSDVKILEELLRNGDKSERSLRAFPGLAEAAEKAGGMSTGFFEFENEAASWRALVEASRNDSTSAARLFSQTQWGARLPGESQQLAGWIDMALLPPFEAIGKYFYIRAASVASESGGLRGRVWWPAPPAGKP